MLPSAGRRIKSAQAKCSCVSSDIHLLCIYGKGIIAKIEGGPASSLGSSEGVLPLSGMAGVGEAAGTWDVCHGAGIVGAELCPLWCFIHREHCGHNRDGHRGGGAGVRGSRLPQDQVRLVLGWPAVPEAPCSPSHPPMGDAKSQEAWQGNVQPLVPAGLRFSPLLYWKAELQSLILQQLRSNARDAAQHSHNQ